MTLAATAFLGWVADETVGIEPLWSGHTVNARGAAKAAV